MIEKLETVQVYPTVEMSFRDNFKRFFYCLRINKSLFFSHVPCKSIADYTKNKITISKIGTYGLDSTLRLVKNDITTLTK